MREDPYTGAPIDDGDEIAALLDADILSEFDVDDEFDTLGDENEMELNVCGVADGVRSLRDAADLLYELADEFLALAADGWEILDDITDGRGVAVRLDPDEETTSE